MALFTLVAAGSALAQATTYSIQSPTYTTLSPAPGCTIGECYNYVATDRVQGTITLSAPLAANLVNADIGPQITAYSISDGARTYTLAPNFNIFQASVTTNGAGVITAFSFAFQRTPGPPYPVATPADPNSYASTILLTDTSTTAVNNFGCQARGAGPSAASNSAANGSCSTFGASPPHSSGASVNAPVTFAVVAAPTAVPTLGEWAMILFSLALAMAAFVLIQRRAVAI